MKLIVILSAILLTTATAASAGRAPVFGGCISKVQVRPRVIVFACGDGNFFVTNLKWSRWDTKEARATGIGHQNDCEPDCARGHFHRYAVAVRLSAPTVCAGLNEFATITWRFLTVKPPRVPRRGAESFSCHWRKVRP
jgi:hypothetical protein